MKIKRVKYVGEEDALLTIGKVYNVIEIDNTFGWYRVIDDFGYQYLWSPDKFEIVEGDAKEIDWDFVEDGLLESIEKYNQDSH